MAKNLGELKKQYVPAELLAIQKFLNDSVAVDTLDMETLDEINLILSYALGWCRGWLCARATETVKEI